MAEGSQTSGGHTFNMGSNTTGCNTCHSNVADFDHFSGQTNTQALLDELGALPETAGIMHYVLNDGSLGVHNPAYVRALLEGSIAAMQ